MNFGVQPVDLFRSTTSVGHVEKKADSIGDSGFGNAIKQALQATSDIQSESGRLSKEFTLNNPTVSLEQTMISGVKSSINFQATLQTRNKLAQAYSDIMNMQV